MKFLAIFSVLFFLTACITADEAYSERLYLKRVTTEINQYKYITDLKNYGVVDYWATPEEFYLAGGGDCEDYVIVKGDVLLKSKKYNLHQLEVVAVYDMLAQDYHAVLRVRGQYILDNQNNEVYPFLQPWHQEMYAVPYEVFRGGKEKVREWLEIRQRTSP